MDATPAYFDRQYNARASVQDAGALIARYAQHSQAAFVLPGAVRHQRYSPRPTDLLDIYLPPAQTRQGPTAPVFIYLHGGSGVRWAGTTRPSWPRR
ncbi:UNVERIFIED_ORG: acetyl esterase/lipase [Comamonas terrigena]